MDKQLALIKEQNPSKLAELKVRSEEIKARRERDASAHDVKMKQLRQEDVRLCQEMLEMPMSQGDAHMSQRLRDCIINAVSAVNAAGATPPDPATQFLPDLSQTLRDVFYIPASRKVSIPELGKHLAADFRQKFGKEPEKTTKYVGGGDRPVNTYRKTHEAWYNASVRQWLALKKYI
jgi:hypothetical protein